MGLQRRHAVSSRGTWRVAAPSAAALVLALAGALAGTAAAAPAAPALTLERAMALAREGARPVAAAEARGRAAEARADEARAQRLPRLTVTEIWLRTDSPAEAFALQLNQEVFSFAEFVASDPNDPDPIEAATTRFEVSLPLYTGGELSGRIRQAELAAEAAGAGASRAGDGAAFAAAEAWVRLAQAREQAALLERSLATVEAHAARARAYVEQGMLVASELLRAQVEVARVADLAVSAEGAARTAEAALSLRLGAPLGSSWELASLPAPPEPAGDLEIWLARGGERPDLAAGRLGAEAVALEVAVARAGRRLRVGLSARYDFVDDVPFGTGGDSAAIQAMAGFDLFAGGRHRAAVAAAEAEAEAAAREVEELAEAVRLEVRSAYEAAATARSRHATAVQALAVAAEVERITSERFGQGVARTIDLIDAATARREAETRELVARAEAHLSALGLALAAGRPPEEAIAGGARAGEPEPGMPEPGAAEAGTPESVAGRSDDAEQQSGAAAGHRSGEE